MRTLLHGPADTGAATGESIAGAVALNPAAAIKRRMAYALAGLAVIAAVTVALAAAPAPAQAQSGPFCIGFDGVLVSPGELVRRIDRSDPRRIYVSTYLCKDDGRLALLYRDCTGPDCWPYEQRNPPILAFGGGGGSAGCSRGEIDYWFAHAYETDVFCNA
jgi:hypothetical protein